MRLSKNVYKQIRKFEFQVFHSFIFGLMTVYLCATLLVFAGARSVPYGPGDTLDPDCAPYDTNCFVQLSNSGSSGGGSSSDNNFSSIHVSGGSLSVASPASTSASITYNTDVGYPDNGYAHNYRVYSYKDTSSGRVYSSTYASIPAPEGTIGDPANLQITQQPTEDTSAYDPNSSSGNTFNFRIYAFKNVPGGRVYSSNYTTLDTDFVAENTGSLYTLGLTWDPVDGADGYRILKYTNTGMAYDYGHDVLTNSFTDSNSSAWSQNPIIITSEGILDQNQSQLLYTVNLSWDAVPGADGYRIVKSNQNTNIGYSYFGYVSQNYDVGYDTTSTSIIDDACNTVCFDSNKGDVSLTTAYGESSDLNGLFSLSGPILLNSNGYFNWGGTSGSDGYGIRDNAGTLEYKNSNGTWSSFATSGGGASGLDANGNFIVGITGYNNNLSNSVFIGTEAGLNAHNASRSNFFGQDAGYNAQDAAYSNFFGINAGRDAANAYNSTFLGNCAGCGATNANNSIFLGTNSGNGDMVNNYTNDFYSILIGPNTHTGGYSNSIALGSRATNTASGQVMFGSNEMPINQLVINGSNAYINFTGTAGQSGYGIRDNGGTIEYKNSWGNWSSFSSGGGGGGYDQLEVDSIGTLNNFGVVSENGDTNRYTKFYSGRDGNFAFSSYQNYGNGPSFNDIFTGNPNGSFAFYGLQNDDGGVNQRQTLYLGNDGYFELMGNGISNNGNDWQGDILSVNNEGAATFYGWRNNGESGGKEQLQTLYLGSDGYLSLAGNGSYPNGSVWQRDTFNVSPQGEVNIYGSNIDLNGSMQQYQTLYLNSRGTFELVGNGNFGNVNWSGDTMLVNPNGDFTLYGWKNDGANNGTQNRTFNIDPSGALELVGSNNFGNGIQSNETFYVDSQGSLVVRGLTNNGSGGTSQNQTVGVDPNGTFTLYSLDSSNGNSTRFNLSAGEDISLAQFTNTNILLSVDDGAYLNFGNVAGESGYGIRDNAGTLEYKNSGGSWGPFGGGASLNDRSSFIIGGGANVYYSNFMGYFAGSGAAGSSNSNFLGSYAGYNATNAYSSNFFGYNAGSGAADAIYSNFFGTNAGQNVTNGVNSNFLGYEAGREATNAFGSNFLGYEAGRSATNASNSIFFGSNTGNGATNAANSIFIGSGAGSSDTVNNTTNGGDYSILIGQNTSTGGYSNSIALGKFATNTASNQLMIGSSSYYPINTTIFKGSSSTQCTITTGTGISCSSDIRLKKNIMTLDNIVYSLKTTPTNLATTLDRLAVLSPVTYNWTKEKNTDPKHIGLIAQELEQVFPLVVSTDTDGFKSVNYANLTPYIIQAIKEMNIKVALIPTFTDPTLYSKISEFLKGVAEKGTAVVDSIITKKVKTDELCVGNVCVTSDQFLKMVQSSSAQPVSTK